MCKDNKPNCTTLVAKLHNRRVECAKMIGKNHYIFIYKNLMSREKYDSYKGYSHAEEVLRKTDNYVLTTTRIDLSGEAVEAMYYMTRQLFYTDKPKDCNDDPSIDDNLEQI